MFRIILTDTAIAHYNAFVKSGNVKIVNRIKALLADIALHPYTGIGKPEALKYSLAGMWSRRINREHRLVYTVDENRIIVHILAMHSHYGDK
ncbi:MAG: Txe/YoeB family addiction module toxin [Muribaculaceae bacterium]|nr:Txe/YoeB family addiction module toxin [Muribaculaceae bacterium]